MCCTVLRSTCMAYQRGYNAGNTWPSIPQASVLLGHWSCIEPQNHTLDYLTQGNITEWTSQKPSQRFSGMSLGGRSGPFGGPLSFFFFFLAPVCQSRQLPTRSVRLSWAGNTNTHPKEFSYHDILRGIGIGRVYFFQIRVSRDHLHIIIYITIGKTDCMFAKLHNNIIILRR